ncbi:MAG: hypothetical protein NC122_01810 [Faecalibacterium sp.]|nr:hypothetical protein [Ruminococcus sp.]MCM1391619.1 hypothetical protein [Ruminococcus sp.]MCM1484919.1 hypothetical protein [Faecalibacterium sp.]
MSYKSQAGKTAIGGMMVALSVIIMIPSVFETFELAIPAMASVLVLFSVVELGKAWSFGVYAATSIVSLIVVPNKQAVIMYIVVFGYYPIIKSILESKLPKVLEYVLKFLIFNASAILSFFLITKVLGVPFDEFMGITNKESFFGRYAVAIILVFANIIFLMLDYCFTCAVTVYVRRFQKKFHKMFRFK